MPRSYTPEFKKKIVRLHLDEGRAYKSITAEYGVSKASISAWCSEFSKECQAKAIADPETKNEAYDNAPMERYFNTLKNECTNLYEFETEEALYQKVEEFTYVDYNHVRPHSFNGYRTPYEARTTT